MGTRTDRVQVIFEVGNDGKLKASLLDVGKAGGDAARGMDSAADSAQRMNIRAVALGTVLGDILSGSIRALGAAARGATDRMDELSKAAQRAGMPTEEFSRLAYAGELADVSMDTLVSTLGRLTKAQAAALKDNSEQARVFEALGISVTNAEGKLRSGSAVLLDFADRFKALEGSPEAMAAGFSLFGRSFQEVIPLLKDGSAGLREAAAESDALGKTLSTEAGRAAEEFNDNITRLQSAVGGAAMEIAQGMLPSLNRMTGELVAAAKETDSLRSFGEGLVTVLGGVGDAFGFVSGMARQFGIDVGAAIDAATGWAEVTKNIASLGLADGSVSGGFGRISNARQTRAQLLQDAQNQRAAAAASANTDRLIAGGTGVYNGPLLATDAAAGSANSAALRAAFAKPAEGKAKTIDAETVARQRLAQQMAQAIADSDREIALMSIDQTHREELTRLYDVQNGKMREASQQDKDAYVQKGRELDLARQLELMRKREKDLEEASMAVKRRAKEAGDAMLADMRFELELLGMSNREREKAIALKRLQDSGSGASPEEVAKLVGDLQDARDLELFKGDLKGLFIDIGMDVDNASDALDHFFDTLKRRALDAIADDLIGKLFPSSTGSASSGEGGWMSAIGSVLGSLFGGGRASGGSVSGSHLYEVAERGQPEVFEQNGRRYLIPGGDGWVTPAMPVGGAAPTGAGGSGGYGAVTINNYGNPNDVRTEERTGPGGMRELLVFVQETAVNAVAADVQKGGKVAKAGQGAYGWQRQGVMRG